MGVGIGPAFALMQASVGTCLPTHDAARTHRHEIDGSLPCFWLVYSVASGILVEWIL